MTKQETHLRDMLVRNLTGGFAHMPLEEAVASFPEEHFNTRPPHVSYTFWHLLEHIRLTQGDILNYVRSADYVEPHWPQDYWPAKTDTATREDWEQTLALIEQDTAELIAMVRNPKIDVLVPLPHLKDVTLMQEIELVAEHNSYHIGEFAILRQVLNLWPPDHH